MEGTSCRFETGQMDKRLLKIELNDVDIALYVCEKIGNVSINITLKGRSGGACPCMHIRALIHLLRSHSRLTRTRLDDSVGIMMKLLQSSRCVARRLQIARIT